MPDEPIVLEGAEEPDNFAVEPNNFAVDISSQVKAEKGGNCSGCDMKKSLIDSLVQIVETLTLERGKLKRRVGETVKLPAPKNHFLKDVVIDTDVPVFATTKAPILYRGPYNMEDEWETKMMNSRWRKIQFKHVFEEEQQKNLKPCGSCFAKLILMGEDYTIE